MVCSLIRRNRVMRGKGDKWKTTKREFEGDFYPPYCAGWSYVVNLKAVKVILEEAEKDIK